MADIPIDKFLCRKIAGEYEIDERTLLAALTTPNRRHKTVVGAKVARAKSAYLDGLRARGILLEEPPEADPVPEPAPPAPSPPASADATPIPTGDPAMRNVHHTFPHTLSVEEVVRRAKIAFDDYATKYPDAQASVTWTSPSAGDVSFRAADTTWTIHVDVTSTYIALSADVEDRFEMIVNLAVEKIGGELHEWLTL